MTQSRLKALREELEPRVTQETVARRADILLSTYRNAEAGKPVSYATALAIWTAVNSLRKDHNLEPIRLEDMGFR